MKETDKDLIELYLDGFDDSYDFATMFINSVESDNIVRHNKNGKLVSVGYIVYKDAYLFDKKQSVPYLSALSTRKECRGQGLMGKVIAEMFDRLYKRGDCLAVLHPFNDIYYKRFGFADISHGGYGTIIGGVDFVQREFSDADFHVMSDIEHCQARNFDNYLLPTQAALTSLAEAFAADKSVCKIIYDGTTPFAYVFGAGDKIEYYATTDTAKFEKMNLYKGWRYDRFDLAERVYIQARVICAQKILELYNYKKDLNCSINLEITDNIILQNNVRLNIKIFDGAAKIQRTEDKPDFVLSAEQLCEYLFHGGLGIFHKQKTLFKEKY